MGLLAKNCNIKGGYEAIRKMVKDQDGRDRYLDSADALKFGIVDAVGMPRVEKVSLYQVGLNPPKTRITKTEETKKTAKKKQLRKNPTLNN
jgi:hypothetical protein